MKERKKNFIDHHGKMPHQVPKDLEAVYFYDCWIGYFPFRAPQVRYMRISEDEMCFILSGDIGRLQYIHDSENLVYADVKLKGKKGKAEPVSYTVRWDEDDDEDECTKWQRSAIRDGELWLWLKRGKYTASTRDDDFTGPTYVKHDGKWIRLESY